MDSSMNIAWSCDVDEVFGIHTIWHPQERCTYTTSRAGRQLARRHARRSGGGAFLDGHGD